MGPPSQSTDERRADWAARLYALAQEAGPDKINWSLYRSTGADRDYFVSVFPRLLEAAQPGPTRRGELFVFELHSDCTARAFYLAAELWRAMPGLSAEDRADSDALSALLSWFEAGAPRDALVKRPGRAVAVTEAAGLADTTPIN